MLRHTWATNYNRSRTGSTFDLQVEGGWTTARMVDRYCKVRPLDERRRAPSPFTGPRAARLGVEKRPSEKRPLPKKRISAEAPRNNLRVNIASVARRGFEPLTSSLKGKRPRPLGDRAGLCD